MAKPKQNYPPHPNSPDGKDAAAVQRENLSRQLRANQLIREHCREIIQPVTLINELYDIKTQMLPVTDPLDPNRKVAPDPQMLAALRARADINFKLLDKALPNLKATEVTGSVDHNHSGEIEHKVSDIELASRLQLWRQQQIASAGNVIDITHTAVREDTVESTEEDYEWM